MILDRFVRRGTYCSNLPLKANSNGQHNNSATTHFGVRFA